MFYKKELPDDVKKSIQRYKKNQLLKQKLEELSV